MGWSKVGLGDLSRSLVRLQGLVGGGLALIAHSELGEVTMVVTLPAAELFVNGSLCKLAETYIL